MRRDEIARLSPAGALAALGTSAKGLTERQAAARIGEYGENRLKRRRVLPVLIFARQFESSLVYLLLAACVISFFLHNVSDSIVIGAILLINTSLAFIQEYRSEKTVERLNEFISKKVFVRRDDRLSLIDEALLVPGDVAVLRKGDVVPADMRLIEADNLELDESSLTGESVPVAKQALEAGREGQADCLLFAGTTIQRGKAAAIVYATGNATEIGSVAVLSSTTKRVTQYEKWLRSFGGFLIKAVLVVLVFVFAAKLAVARDLSAIGPLLLFLVALAIAVIPEALPVIATVTMSAGALKLARKNVVVKRLSSLEDLGNINLLCTDKTGTLTENRMEITRIVSEEPRLFQKLAFASIEAADIEEGRNPYDLAFMSFIPRDIKEEASGLVMERELPFDPELRQRRVVLREEATGTGYLVVVGSAETLLAISRAQDADGLLAVVRAEGRKGMRSIAVAYREVTGEGQEAGAEKDGGLVFLGFATFTSPLRSSARKTIETAQRLGVGIKILSGDSREVVEYVAREVGLIGPGEQVLTEADLSSMSAGELRQAAISCKAFACISPARKLSLIESVREETVVAYQGDGINDAPALNAADVGIAVDSAVDIAKEAADIILLDPGLDVIINGIDYGRSIFANINKYIKYTMVGNWGNFFALATLYVFASELPLLPVQVLLTSLITDIPLITISGDKVDAAEVVGPEKRDSRTLILISIVLGVPTALFELFFFGTLSAADKPFARTSFFLFLTCLQLVVIFSIRNKDFFWKGERPWGILTALFACAFLFSFSMPYLPSFRRVFSFVPIPAAEVGRILLSSLVYFIVLDVVKVIYYRWTGTGRRESPILP